MKNPNREEMTGTITKLEIKTFAAVPPWRDGMSREYYDVRLEVTMRLASGNFVTFRAPAAQHSIVTVPGAAVSTVMPNNWIVGAKIDEAGCRVVGELPVPTVAAGDEITIRATYTGRYWQHAKLIAHHPAPVAV